jgi:hypothetical protein
MFEPESDNIDVEDCSVVVRGRGRGPGPGRGNHTFRC